MIIVRGQLLTLDNWTELLGPKAELARDEILNTLGDINRYRKFMDKVEKFLKEVLPSKFDSDEFEYATARYHFIRTHRSKVSLDTERVKTEMGEEWYKEHCTVTDYYQINIKEIEPT